MREDIEVEVVHDAPVLLRNRRGAQPLPAVARQTARSRIRHAPIDPQSPKHSVTGEYARINGGLVLFEGRLWRGVSGIKDWGTGRSDEAFSSIPSVREALAYPPVTGIREDLWQLSLTPLDVRNQYGRTGDHARVLDAATLDPGKLLLDLRAEASAAVARRVSADLIHDGARVWTAIPTPMLRNGSVPSVYAVEPPGRSKLSFDPLTLADQIEGYIAYVERTEPLTKPAAERLRQVAGVLSRELAGLDPTPLADIRRNVRRNVILTHLAASPMGDRSRDWDSEAIARLSQDLLPLVARASADLIDDRDLPEAVDRTRALAARTLELCGRPGMEGSHNLYALRRVVAYVDLVARPRLAAQAVPESDVESLGSLAP